jgi:hypothetical protein
MTTPQYVWPTHAFVARTQKWQLRGSAKTGGSSLTGLTQASRTEGGGYWVTEQDDITLQTADEIRAWRAWEVILDGGATPFIFPICDPRQRPDVMIGGVATKAHVVPHSDDTTFSDGSPYESVPIDATVTVGAALRGVQLTMNIPNVTLRGGEYFSIEHPNRSHRLYRVRTIESQVGDVVTMTFRPPLREAVVSGEKAEFNTPRIVMRVVDGDQMPAPIEEFRRSKVRAIFVEHPE